MRDGTISARRDATRGGSNSEGNPSIPGITDRMRRYGFALLTLALGAALSTSLVIRDGAGTPAIVAFFVILISAWYGGIGPGLMITLLIASTASGAPFVPWRVVRLALFVAGGAAISAMAESL